WLFIRTQRSYHEQPPALSANRVKDFPEGVAEADEVDRVEPATDQEGEEIGRKERRQARRGRRPETESDHEQPPALSANRVKDFPEGVAEADEVDRVQPATDQEGEEIGRKERRQARRGRRPETESAGDRTPG